MPESNLFSKKKNTSPATFDIFFFLPNVSLTIVCCLTGGQWFILPIMDWFINVVVVCCLEMRSTRTWITRREPLPMRHCSLVRRIPHRPVRMACSLSCRVREKEINGARSTMVYLEEKRMNPQLRKRMTGRAIALKFSVSVSLSFSIWFNWIGTATRSEAKGEERAQLVDRVNTRPTDVHYSFAVQMEHEWWRVRERERKKKWKWHTSLCHHRPPFLSRSLARFFLISTPMDGWDSGALMYFSNVNGRMSKNERTFTGHDVRIRDQTWFVAQLGDVPWKKALTFLSTSSNDMDRWGSESLFRITRLLTRAEWIVPMNWLMVRRSLSTSA